MEIISKVLGKVYGNHRDSEVQTPTSEVFLPSGYLIRHEKKAIMIER